jgi:hypothetical protein
VPQGEFAQIRLGRANALKRKQREYRVFGKRRTPPGLKKAREIKTTSKEVIVAGVGIGGLLRCRLSRRLPKNISRKFRLARAVSSSMPGSTSLFT